MCEGSVSEEKNLIHRMPSDLNSLRKTKSRQIMMTCFIGRSDCKCIKYNVWFISLTGSVVVFTMYSCHHLHRRMMLKKTVQNEVTTQQFMTTALTFQPIGNETCRNKTSGNEVNMKKKPHTARKRERIPVKSVALHRQNSEGHWNCKWRRETKLWKISETKLQDPEAGERQGTPCVAPAERHSASAGLVPARSASRWTAEGWSGTTREAPRESQPASREKQLNSSPRRVRDAPSGTFQASRRI